MNKEQLQQNIENMELEIAKMKQELDKAVVYDEERGLFDKQLVWCWDNYETHTRAVRFYDAKNRCTFDFEGDRDNSDWNYYEPYEGDYPKWAVEAYKTLKD